VERFVVGVIEPLFYPTLQQVGVQQDQTSFEQQEFPQRQTLYSASLQYQAKRLMEALLPGCKAYV